MRKVSIPGNKIVLLSIPQVILIAITGITALSSPNFYAAETADWQAQSLGQDLIDVLLVFPLLIISSTLASKDNRRGFFIWGGINFYLLYTYLIYCFAVHFNIFFIFYCVILGISFYSSVLFLYTLLVEEKETGFQRFYLSNIVGIYLIVIACLFYLLWLADIIPAIMHNKTPASVREAGLFTNPVHVLDIAVVLPGIFSTGLLLLRKKSAGYGLAAAVLVFISLMDITIGVLVLFMKYKGIQSNGTLAVIMALLFVFTFILLIACFKSSNLQAD